MKHLIFTLSFLALILSPSAKAGQERGGGDVLICKIGFPGFKTTFLADTYNSKDSHGRIGIRTKLSKEVRIKLIGEELNASVPGLGDAILTELKHLRFNFVDEVEELDGDNIKVPKGCTKKQLAIQDVETGEVRTNKKLYKKLNKWEKAFFEVHEAFISLKNPGPDTTPVRNEVLSVIQSENFTEILNKAIWPVSLTWDQLVDGTAHAIGHLSGKKCSDIRSKVLQNMNFFSGHPDFAIASVGFARSLNSTAGWNPEVIAVWLTHYATAIYGTPEGYHFPVREDPLRVYLRALLEGRAKLPKCN